MANLGKVLATITAAATLSVACFASAPVWVLKDPSYLKSVTVEQVNRESVADIILLSSGAESRMQIGAQCSILRNRKEIARAVVVEANADKAVAMVTSGESVKVGDEVGILLSK